MMKMLISSLIFCFFVFLQAHAADGEPSLSDQIRKITQMDNFPPPSFLQHVTEEARKEYVDFARDQSLSWDAFKQKEKEWKKKQPANIQKEVDQFNDFFHQHIGQARKNATHTMEELPKIFERAMNILANTKMARKEVFEKFEQNILSNDHQTSEVAVAILKIFTEHKKRPHGHGGPHTPATKHPRILAERYNIHYA